MKPNVRDHAEKTKALDLAVAQIEKVTLMESELRPQGALYRPVKSIALTGSK